MLDTPQNLSPLDRFRQAVMADEAAQQMLATPYDPREFQRLAIEWARRHGIALTADDLSAVRGIDPVGAGMIGPAPQNGAALPPRGWLPLRFVTAEAAVDWIHFAGEPLTESFYFDSLRSLQSRPFNQLFRYRTPFDALVDDDAAHSLLPDGFIFHMSRCGSTTAAILVRSSAIR